MLRLLAPLSESFAPGFGLAGCILISCHALIQGLGLIYPGAEIIGSEFRKREKQVLQVTLGVDGDHLTRTSRNQEVLKKVNS